MCMSIFDPYPNPSFHKPHTHARGCQADTLLTIQRLEAEIAENLAESKVAQTR